MPSAAMRPAVIEANQGEAVNAELQQAAEEVPAEAESIEEVVAEEAPADEQAE